MSKTIEVDCELVHLEPRAREYFHVELTTNYPDEILNSFDTDEIIEDYTDLDKLYEALRDHFEEC